MKDNSDRKYSNEEKQKLKSIKITISMPEALVKELDRFCFGHSYDRSEAMKEAVRRFING